MDLDLPPENPAPEPENRPRFDPRLVAACTAFVGIVGFLGSLKASMEFVGPFAGPGLAVVLILAFLGLLLRRHLNQWFLWFAAVGLVALAALFVVTLIFWQRPKPPDPTPPGPTPVAVVTPPPSPVAKTSPESTLPPRPRRTSPPAVVHTATPTLQPSVPPPSPTPTPRIDWRAELMAGRPVIARITRTAWEPNVQIMTVDYRIQFIEAVCEWRATGTVDRQKYGIVENFTSRFAPGLTPFSGQFEMRGSSGAPGECPNPPTDHKAMILNIVFTFDSNGVLYYYRRQPVGQLLRAP